MAETRSMASRGSVQIEVVADTSKVPAQVERELKAALKGVQLEPVKVQGDTQPFLRNVQEASAQTERTLGGLFSRLRSRVSSGGGGLGSAIGDNVKGGVVDAFKSAASAAAPAAAALGASLGGVVTAAVAPVVISGIAAAITVAGALVAGAGIIGIGALALKENEKLVAEAKSTVDTIKQVFSSAAQPLVEPFADALKEVRSVIKSVQPDLKALFAGVAPAVRSLTAAFGPALKSILVGLKAALPGINAAFAGLAKAIPIIGDAVGRFFATVFADAPLIEKLTKDFGVFAAVLIDVAAPAVRGLTVIFGVFVNLSRVAAKGWAQAWATITAAFDGGTGALMRITQAWEPLKVAIYAVWDALKQFAIAETDEQLAASMLNVVQKIKEAWGPLKEFLGVIWDEAWAFVIRVWNEKVIPWWNGTARPFLEQQVKSFVVSIFSSMVNEAVGLLLSLPFRAAAALAGLGASIRGAVLNAVAGAASWLFGAGSSIVGGLVNGIFSRIGAVAAAAARLGQIIRDNKGPESYDRVMLKPAGELIVQGLMAGIGSQQSALSRQMMGVTESIAAAPMGVQARGGDGASADSGGGLRVWGSQQAPTLGTLVIESDGTAYSELLVQTLAKAVRVRGGNVQKVVGTSQGGVE